jgi:alpha-tubulin suppressor-like RCC1 family protein
MRSRPFALWFRGTCALALGLTAGTLGCGEDAEAPTVPATTAPQATPTLATTSTPLSFLQVSAGSHHTCGVTTANRAYCWGDNSRGQLGDGTQTSRTGPVAVKGGLTFLRVSAGDAHTCGITSDNKAYCWGSNDDGRLGNGSTDIVLRLTPIKVAGTRTWRQVSAGYDHTCAVTTTDEPFCWGSNVEGQGGSDGSFHASPARVLGGLLFRQIIAGAYHTCGATTSSVGYCWGADALGNATVLHSNRPTRVSGGLHFKTVVAGSGLILIPSEEHEQFYSCGISTDDLAYCWGDGSTGVFGAGTSISFSRTPVAVSGGHQFKGINLGNIHVCGVTFTNTVFCWGTNQHGQIGDGSTVLTRWVPVRVFGDTDYKSVTTNVYSEHSCAVTAGSKAHCWGWNSSGQVGDGTTTDKYLPVPVIGP